MTEELVPQKPNEKLKVAQVIAALHEAKGVKLQAAQALGVDWNTIHRYVTRYPTCRAALTEATIRVSDKAIQNVVDAIEAGDLGESHWWLSRKDPSFRDLSEQRQTGPDGGPIQHEVKHGVDLGEYTGAFEALFAVRSTDGLQDAPEDDPPESLDPPQSVP